MRCHLLADASEDQSGTNVSRKAPFRSGKLLNVCAALEFKTPTRADASGRSLKFPKVEVAGSSPVPRSTKKKFNFRTSVLGNREDGKKLRSFSHGFSHELVPSPNFFPRT